MHWQRARAARASLPCSGQDAGSSVDGEFARRKIRRCVNVVWPTNTKRRTRTGALVTFNFARSITLFAATALAATIVDAGHALRAQGRLDARYTVSLSGLPVGKGAWVVEIADDRFTAAANGSTAGLLRVFASGQGQSEVRGSIVGGHLVPSTYVSAITTDK